MLVDLLHLARSLRRSPASAAAAILTLSLTLGAGASIFAVVHAVLLAPLPFANPDALVVLGEAPIDDAGGAARAVSYGTFDAWRVRAGRMASLEAADGTNLTLTGFAAAERMTVNDATPGFLALLGIAPAIGRSFEPQDVGRPVAIVSDGFWRGKLGADPRVIGRDIVLGSQAHTIIGVLPANFVFDPNPSDIWRPLPVTPAQAVRTGYRVGVIARLSENASLESLAGALDAVSRASSPPARAIAIPIATAVSGRAAGTLALLAGAAAIAVLVAFANFAGLLLVRSIDRSRELAIRSALGARRSEAYRQLLLEGQALVALGIAGGVLLAWWMTPFVARLALQQFGGLAHRQVAVSWQVVVAVAAAASACAAMCALLPARMARRRTLLDVLRRGATAPPAERASRRLLVSGEVALAFVLLVCVALVGRSLLRMVKIDPGFDAGGVLALHLSVPAAGYPLDRVVSFYAALHTALEERLGYRSTAVVNELPLTGDGGRALVSVRSGDPGREAVLREASPGYFDVMRIPVVAGRAFDARDNLAAPARAVISESLSERLFAREQPVGRRIRLTRGAEAAEVIGVVSDVKQRALDERAAPTVYLSMLQSPSRSTIVVVRSTRPDGDVAAVVREEVTRLDGNLPIYGVRSMKEVVAASAGVPARRVLTATFTGFALLALVLGAIGLFGVVAHDVASRRVELALRIALGAAPMRILIATLAQAAVMVGAGLAAGALLTVWAARVLDGAGLLANGVDAASVGVPATMLIAAAAAAVLPAARRAMRIDPVAALHGE